MVARGGQEGRVPPPLKKFERENREEIGGKTGNEGGRKKKMSKEKEKKKQE